MQIYINGTFYSEKEAKISVLDHGLLYGDGVFEGIRVYSGKIFKLKEHLKRLYQSAEHVMLSIPLTQVKMTEAVVEAVKKNNLSEAYIRLIVTRGNGGLGLDPFICKNPQVIIIVDKIQLYPKEFYEKGLEIVSSSIIRTPEAALSPRIKSLNYLNNILAKIEALHAGVPESLMYNAEGFVVECTGDNIFAIKNSEIYTPPVSCGILEGITRASVIDIACKLGYTVSEKLLTRHDLYTADELFLTGTAAEIVPVVLLDKRKIGTGKPGIITLSLIKNFKELTKQEGIHAL